MHLIEPLREGSVTISNDSCILSRNILLYELHGAEPSVTHFLQPVHTKLQELTTTQTHFHAQPRVRVIVIDVNTTCKM